MTSSQPQPGTTNPVSNPSYTTIELHSPSTLIKSPHLPALFSLVNHTFNLAHQRDGHSYLPWDERTRLKTHEQLGQEVGPDGFILMMLDDSSTPDTTHENASYQTKGDEGFVSPGGQRIVGTASAKPYAVTKTYGEAGGEVHHFFKRPPPTASTEIPDDTPQWEVLAMAVDPTLQGRGLATQLMNLTVDEIKRRCGSNLRDPDTATSDATGSKSEDVNIYQRKEVLLLLSTLKDLNETYYAKRGWTATATREFPKGTLGSRDGFRVVEMFKRVAL